MRLTRHGKPVAVLLGYTEFDRLVSDRRDFSAAYGEFSESHDLEDLNIAPDEVFGDSRDESAGRDVSL